MFESSVLPPTVGVPAFEVPPYGAVEFLDDDGSLAWVATWRPPEERLAGVPGADLSTALEELRIGHLGEGSLVDTVSAAGRVMAWAQAVQFEAIAEMAFRPPFGTTPGGRVTVNQQELHNQSVAAEVGFALQMSLGAARDKVALAATLVERLPGTLSALRLGMIDLARTRVLADAASAIASTVAESSTAQGLSPAEREKAVKAAFARVERQVLDRAPTQTPGQLRQCVARAVIAVDPAIAAARANEAVASRRAWITPLPDAMAELAFQLPAPDAMGVWNTLDCQARAARAAGDPRTLDQLRVDGLVAGVLGAGEAAAGCIPGGGTRNRSAEDSGRHSGDGRAGGSTDCAARAAEPPTNRRWKASRRRLAQVLVTVSSDTLLGADDEPGELAGYGPIPAHLARAIAADATWRRILTDPRSGQLLDFGRTTYTPPAALADHVIARDRSCDAPGCTIEAAACDLDHLIPYPMGPTADYNLGPRCRGHHRVKHAQGWSVVRNPPDQPPGTTVWTSPRGRTYIRPPTAVGAVRPERAPAPPPTPTPTPPPTPPPPPAPAPAPAPIPEPGPTRDLALPDPTDEPPF